MTARILLAGASVRSLAASAIRCGLMPVCFDMFGDADLRHLVSAAGENAAPTVFQKFSELPELLRDLDDSLPLVWAGGLENHPHIVKQLARQRHVAGADAELLETIRSPLFLTHCLTGLTCRTPQVLTALTHVEAASCQHIADSHLNFSDRRWVCKLVDTSGGIGIRFLPSSSSAILQDEYLQEFVDGVPMSATFYALGEVVSLHGVHLQIVGDRRLGASGFQFCGNAGPVQVSSSIRSQLLVAARALSERGLRGVFGLDFVLVGNQVWVIEVNPRITASHEVSEWQPGASCQLQLQLAAFRPSETADFPDFEIGDRHSPASWNRESIETQPAGGARADVVQQSRSRQSRNGRTMVCRMIVYAEQDLILESSTVNSMLRTASSRIRDESYRAWFADIPVSGSRVTAGTPVCSVYVQWPDPPGDLPDGLQDSIRRLFRSQYGIPDKTAQVTMIASEMDAHCRNLRADYDS